MPKDQDTNVIIGDEETSHKKFSWESLQSAVFLVPLIFWAIFRTLKSGTLWTLSAGNPGLTFGGFFGFPKTDAYNNLPKGTYPETVLIKPSTDYKAARDQIFGGGLKYPFVAKPNGGVLGLLVRVINDEDQFKKYFDLVKVDWIAQEMVNYKTEIGVFYVRHPKDKKGKIVGVSQKVPLSVVGDGKSTVKELIELSESAQTWKDKIFEKQKRHLNKVLANGEFFQLLFIRNRNNGAHLVEKVDSVDGQMLALFDKLSHHKETFFYGRYDIKCDSLESLKRGENFSILEFNGVHSGYGFLYHCGKSAKEVYKKIHSLWNELYDLSVANHKNGTAYMPFGKGVKYVFNILRYFRKLKKWERELR